MYPEEKCLIQKVAIPVGKLDYTYLQTNNEEFHAQLGAHLLTPNFLIQQIY
jgi:hypothetical protein